MSTSEAMPLRPVRGGGVEATEEQALAASLARGERRAAEELVERTYRTIYAALFRLAGGDAELAADLTQETYRKAWAALGSFRGGAQLSTWLYRIAYTTFLNHIRRPRRLVPLEDAAPGGEPGDPTPPEDMRLAQSAQAERLRRAVLALPEDLRFSVTARFWRGLPVTDIAAAEHVTTVAIRKRLKRAFRILALALEEDAP
jgi:RNA polymerase sigma-70 factor (ECF subfamily)